MLTPDRNFCSDTQITGDFFTLLKLGHDSKDDDDDEEEKFGDNEANHNHGGEDEEEEEEEEEEFSFDCGGANSSPIAAEDAFINGQIKPFSPLFNRDLLYSGEDENLPMRPPVKKLFVETESAPAEAEGPSCEWSERKAVEASPEICKKSNSTGFSKIWRFKDLLGRSNSDGRDAFVFLNSSHVAPSSTVAVEKESKGKGKAKKGKTAYEVYLKSKGKGDDRRRSYLPYRPELMGFFTNVNGGLSKNVHPF